MTGPRPFLTVPGTAKDRTPYDNLLDDRRTTLKQDLSRSFMGAGQTTPDAHAEALSLAEQTGLPRDVVLRNVDTVRARAVQQTTSYDRLIDDSPGLAEWLRQPDNAAVAQDDLIPLTTLAKQLETYRLTSPQALQRQVESFTGTPRSGFWRSLGSGTGLGLIASEKGVGHVLEASGEAADRFFPLAGTLNRKVGRAIITDARASAEFYTPRVGSYKQVETSADLRDYLAFQLGQGVGSMAGIAAASAAGGPAGGVAASTTLAFGDVRDEIERLPVEQAQGTKNALALALAVPIGALDAITPGQLASKLLLRGVSPLIVREAAAHGLTRAVAAATIKSAAAEGGTEVAQEMIQYLGIAAGTGHRMTTDDAIERIVNAGIGGALGGGVFGTAGEVGAAQEAGRQRTFYLALGQTTKDSKLFQRLPEKLQNAVEALTKDGPVSTVYAPIQSFVEYFQSKGVNDPGVIAQEILGERQSYDEAVRTGSDLAIPTARYAVTIAPTEHNAFFAEELRTDPTAMNARELTAHAETLKAEAKQAADVATVAETETDPAALIGQLIAEQVRAAGRSKPEATAGGSLYEAFFRAMGQRLGVDPQALFNRFKPSVGRGGPVVLSPDEQMAAQEQADERSAIQGEPTALADDPYSVPVPRRDFTQTTEAGEFVYARDKNSDLRRNITNVTTEGLIDEMANLLHGINADSNQVFPTIHETQMFNDRGKPWTGMKEPAMKASGRMQQRQKAVARIEAELTNRGVTDVSERVMQRMIGNEGGDPTDFNFALYQSAWHGSPHIFDKFTTAFMGTGEGNQARGWGLYFAGLREVGAFYRNALAREKTHAVDPFGKAHTPDEAIAAITKDVVRETGVGDVGRVRQVVTVVVYGTLQGSTPQQIREVSGSLAAGNEALFNTALSVMDTYSPRGGRLYHVEIPEAHTMLAWDEPLSVQPEAVQQALATLHDPVVDAWRVNGAWEHATGENLYRHLAHNSSPEAASRQLASLGVTGVKYLADNMTPSGRAKSGHNYVVFTGEDVVIKEYEQAANVGGARGRIRIFPDATVAIDLFKSADRSTFLHETGHFYYHVLDTLAGDPNAPQNIVDDHTTLRDWVGAEKGAPLTREQQEQIAKGFEAYLMEGRAPSDSLRGVFFRFKQWLLNLYGHVQQLSVELSPEITKVFDRMLATQAEIAAAEAEQNALPLFDENAAAQVLGEARAADYVEKLRAVRQEGEEILLTRLMRDVQREETAIWKAEREKVRETVASEVDADPAMRARAWLSKGELPSGAPLPDGATAVKLDRKTLESYATRYPDLFRRLPRPVVYTKEGGIHPDVAAGQLGLTSGDELVQALLASENPKLRIERLTDERMREFHPELLSPAELPVEAMKALHNEKRSALLHEELKILVSKEFAAFKEIVTRVARRLPPLEAIRSEAERTIASRVVKTINPQLYLRSERQAGKAALDAVLTGDIDLAFAEKQRELLNHELYRAATNARETVEKVLDEMQKYQKASTRARIGKAGPEYLDQIDAILDRYSFRKSGPTADARREGLREFVKRLEAQGESVSIPESVLAEAQKTSYREITMEGLLGVRDAVRQIDHIAKETTRVRIGQETRYIQEVAAELHDEAASHYDLSADPANVTKRGSAKVKAWASGMVAEHTRMEFLFRALDGFKANGSFWRTMFKPMVDAENVEMQMRRNDAEAMKAIMSVFTRGERRSWFTDRVFIPEAKTAKMDGTFTKANLLMVALNWGNDYNRQALMEGYGWTERQVQAVLSRLDKRDWDTVQALWDHIDSYWPAAKALEQEMTGLAPEKVEAAAVFTTHGEYRGGYFPIAFDPDLSTRTTVLDEAASLSEAFGGTHSRAMTRHGHLKERTNTGGKPLRLEMSVLTDHLSAVTHDLAFRRAVVDVSKIARHPDVQHAIEGALGREMYQQLAPWLRGIAGDRDRSYTHNLERILAHARTGITVAALGLKVTSAAMQTLGYAAAASEIGPKYALSGLRAAYANPLALKRVYGQVTEKSAMMRDRLLAYDRDVRDYARRPGRDLIPSDSAYFVFIGYMDMAVSIPAWLGAYQKAMDGALQNVEAGDEAAAIDYADSVVRTTQAAGGAKDLAAVQRGPEAWKLFTMFYSSMSVVFNQFQETGRQFALEKNVPKLIGQLVMRWFVPALLEEVIRGRGPKDDDDDSWLTYLGRKLLFYPLGAIVLVRDIASAIDFSLETGHVNFSGSPAFGAGQSVTGAGVAAVHAVEGKDLTRAEWKDIIESVGYFAKLPTGQLIRTSEYVHDWITGQEQPANPAAGIYRATMTGKPR